MCVRASVRVLKVHALCLCACVCVCVYRGVGGVGWGDANKYEISTIHVLKHKIDLCVSPNGMHDMLLSYIKVYNLIFILSMSRGTSFSCRQTKCRLTGL